jgi:hypothetical protein
VFDDPSLVSTAGLVPVMSLPERAGLARLVDEQLNVAGGAGAQPERRSVCWSLGWLPGRTRSTI